MVQKSSNQETHSELMEKGVYYALVGNQEDKSASASALAPDAEDNAENSLDEQVRGKRRIYR